MRGNFQQKLSIARKFYIYVATREEIIVKRLLVGREYTTDHKFELRREFRFKDMIMQLENSSKFKLELDSKP